MIEITAYKLTVPRYLSTRQWVDIERLPNQQHLGTKGLIMITNAIFLRPGQSTFLGSRTFTIFRKRLQFLERAGALRIKELVTTKGSAEAQVVQQPPQVLPVQVFENETALIAEVLEVLPEAPVVEVPEAVECENPGESSEEPFEEPSEESPGMTFGKPRGRRKKG